VTVAVHCEVCPVCTEVGLQETETEVMVTGGGVTVKTKLWTALGETPFDAVKVMGNEPLAVGVPLRVPALNVTPPGSVPDSAILGVGDPVAVTVNEPATPSVNVVLFALAMAGA
jgi:hypothetical protein